jgi:hypothetical protein
MSCSVIQVKSEIYKVYVWMRIIRENISYYIDAHNFFGRPHNCVAEDICIYIRQRVDVIECLWNTIEYVDLDMLDTTSFRIWTAFSLKL